MKQEKGRDRETSCEATVVNRTRDNSVQKVKMIAGWVVRSGQVLDKLRRRIQKNLLIYWQGGVIEKSRTTLRFLDEVPGRLELPLIGLEKL